MSEPRRAGLLDLLRSSLGCQFVIPVYQRNYTWNAEREVKQYLSDLSHVLAGDYKNHFLGILIYLEKSIDFSTREFSIIDGQQRLTTTFLTIYAIKSILQAEGNADAVQQLEGQYLTNPFHTDKIKYKLKPLVSDDDVYRCIVEDRIADIENPNSTVLKNYNYIKAYLDGLIIRGYTANDILLALDKLYVVCVPISEEDNAQKIFESINATGVKLTGADLIRNFLLMNLKSDIQDQYYANYWKKIEDNVSTDSKDLEMFFRMYLAIKTYSLVPKNGVYRSFVDWVDTEEIATLDLLKNLLEYAKIFNAINNLAISSLKKELQKPLTDFRKVNSDIPLSMVMELFRLYSIGMISADALGQAIDAVNAFMIRRSICDMDSQNISKLFPTTLKKVIEVCAGSFDNIVSVLNQELVGNNAGTSGSYMPTDTQMHDFLFNANVYKRPALRIIFDRLELNDNAAPVDLSKLSIEHLMPQTATEEWLEELDTDEETYLTNLHRLGNLTLAAKSDNSRMSNLQWEYKNAILASTAHLKMNMELIPIEKWTLAHIEDRTEQLIRKICEVFPYPDVKVAPKTSEEIIDDIVAREAVVKDLFSTDEYEVVKKNNTYCSVGKERGYVIVSSKMYPEGENEKYWFGYRASRFEKIADCTDQRFIFICRNKRTTVFDIPKSFIDEMKPFFNYSLDDDGNIKHYHIVIHKTPDGKVTMLLSKPTLKRIDISEYLIE
ncbi:MAG: DUF262 domain-containing protein [Lachnospiraceae bacterium]